MDKVNCPPLGRRESRRRDRRDAIIAIASQSFLEQGYAGTTMSGIAATMGGSKGTLWSYFASKEELFAAVIDHATTAYRKQLSEILDAPSDDVTATLKRVCASVMNKVVSPEALALYRLVIAEAGRFPEVGQIFYDRAPRQTHILLASFLSGAMAKHQLRETDPMDAARAFLGLCVLPYQQMLLFGLIETTTTEAIAEHVDRGIDLFMRAHSVRD